MYLLKKIYSKKESFNLSSSRAKLIDKNGRCFISAEPGAKIELSAKISLPRSPALGIGTSLKKFTLNFVLLAGQIMPGVEVKLVREKFLNNSPILLQDIECKSVFHTDMQKENEIVNLAAGPNTRRLSWFVVTPEFDNQLGDESILYTFTIKWMFSSTSFYTPEIHLCGLDVEYDFKMNNISTGNEIVMTPAAEITTEGEKNDKKVSNEAFFTVMTLYVSKTGNDKNNDGSSSKPFFSIPAALSRANLDASFNKRYAIIVHPGTYNLPFSLPANVFITGVERNIVRIDAPKIDIDHPSWEAEGDLRSGFSNCVIAGPTPTFDFSKKKNKTSKLLFTDCLINNGINVVSHAAGNQIRFSNSIFFLGSLSQTGGSVQCFNTTFLAKTPFLVRGRPEGQTDLQLYGGSGCSDFDILNETKEIGISGDNKPITINIVGFCSTSGRIIAKGQNVICNVSSSCLAEEPLVTNGAKFICCNFAHSIGYKSNDVTNKFWNNNAPSNMQEAIDRILPILFKFNNENPI